uniref:Uncharacterized protein n=1 Tax=Arundo donax TaxID=35708 RepID=A0A0A9DFD8_ARUDO
METGETSPQPFVRRSAGLQTVPRSPRSCIVQDCLPEIIDPRSPQISPSPPQPWTSAPPVRHTRSHRHSHLHRL